MPEKKKRTVFVVIRHTRAGDHRIGVYDTAGVAHARAEEVADAAARDYGVGRASVFRGELTLNGRALKAPKGSRTV